MLLDSNIVIYASKPAYAYLLDFIQRNPVKVSAITKIEVLGYHALLPDERQFLEGFFQNIDVLPVSEDIVNQAVALRQQRKMTLGDALVAATALCHKLPLVTRNVSDFASVSGLAVVNPVK